MARASSRSNISACAASAGKAEEPRRKAGRTGCADGRWPAVSTEATSRAGRPRAHARAFSVCSGERAGAGRPEAAGPAARRAADALCARVERRPGLHAQLPGMAVGRGPDRAGSGGRLRRGDREPRRPPVADPDPLSRRLGRRRDGDGRTHSSQGPRGRRRQDADHELSRAGAEMPERTGQSDHRRRDVRVGLRAGARRRRRAPRRPVRRWSACIRSPRW